jgi:protein TonB
MEANMTNQRYVTPAMVAAALHAVLLFGFPSKGPNVVVSKPARIKPPVVEFQRDPVPIVVAKHSDETKVEEVKPILGEPPPPEMPETPSPKPGEFEMASSEFKPMFVALTTTHLPPLVGVANGERGGGPIAGDMTDLQEAGHLDRMPRAKVQIAPNYPFELKRNGVEGSVLIEFQVDATGQVVSARVLRSDHREFEEPTLRAVLKWRFEPGRYNGKAVPFRMQIPVDFHLNQD